MEAPKCWICCDQKIILYKKNGIEYACACTCFSDSQMPTIGKKTAKFLARENYKKYLKSKKEGIEHGYSKETCDTEISGAGRKCSGKYC